MAGTTRNGQGRDVWYGCRVELESESGVKLEGESGAWWRGEKTAQCN